MLQTKVQFNAKMEQERNVFLRKQKGETESELLCKMETTEKLMEGRKEGWRKEELKNKISSSGPGKREVMTSPWLWP